MRFVFSNTTEAGISYHAGDRFDDAPAVSYPAKLTRLLFERLATSTVQRIKAGSSFRAS
jgi:tagaturonate reductase